VICVVTGKWEKLTHRPLAHPGSMEAATKDSNNGIKMGDQKGLNP